MPGQVDNQEIEFAPIDLPEERSDRLRDLRPAPDDRLIRIDEEAHTHQAQAEFLDGERRLRLIDEAEAEHHRHAGSVNVGIHQADALAVHMQRECEVGGDGRLADAALSAGHGDDVFHAGQFEFLAGHWRGHGGTL